MDNDKEPRPDLVSAGASSFSPASQVEQSRW